jgi:hypothetical protein
LTAFLEIGFDTRFGSEKAQVARQNCSLQKPLRLFQQIEKLSDTNLK